MAIHFYTNLDNGYLHIAVDEKYQGGVSSYNNWFTRFFSKLFGWSADIQINGQEYRLNKREYVQLLNSVGVNATTKTIAQFRNFNDLHNIAPQNNGFMRDHISPEKVHELGLDLINAVTAQDVARAESLLGEGANPNKYFSWRALDNKFFYGEDLEKDLPHGTIAGFEEYRYTPLLRAAHVQDVALKNLLLRYGADQQLTGEHCQFSRTEMSRTQEVANIPVERVMGCHQEPVVGLRVVPPHHRGNPHHPFRGPKVVPTVHLRTVVDKQPGIDQEVYERLKFHDDWYNIQTMRFDVRTGGVVLDPPSPPRIDQREETRFISRTPIA